MFNNRILAVIKRELREKLLSKSFIIMTLLMPALMFGFILIQTFIMSFEGGKLAIKIVAETPSLMNDFKTELDTADFVKSGKIQIECLSMDKPAFKSYLKSIKKEILDEKTNAVLFIGTNAVMDKKVEIYSQTSNPSITEKLNKPINKVLVNGYFAGRLSYSEMQLAAKGVDFYGYTITKTEGIKEESHGNLVLSYVLTMLLYMGLLTAGTQMMQSVMEEKTNRVVEILLSSLKPKELLGGKIIGASVTSFFQMLIWLSPIILLLSTTLFQIPAKYIPDVSLYHFAYLFFNFICGLIIYIGLFAAVGSIFDNAQDAQQGLMPIMLLILIPFFISFSMLKDPSSPIAEISSMLPFASIIVMPPRMTVSPVAAWQIAVSMLVNILTVFGVILLSGKIYRIGILRTGTKPKWSEVIKWLKYKN